MILSSKFPKYKPYIPKIIHLLDSLLTVFPRKLQQTLFLNIRDRLRSFVLEIPEWQQVPAVCVETTPRPTIYIDEN